MKMSKKGGTIGGEDKLKIVKKYQKRILLYKIKMKRITSKRKKIGNLRPRMEWKVL